MPQRDLLRKQRAKHQPIKGHFRRQRPIDGVKPLTVDPLGNEQHCLEVGKDELGCFLTQKDEQNDQAQGRGNQTAG